MASGISVILQLIFYHPPASNLLYSRSSKVDVLKGLYYGGLTIFTGSLASLRLVLSTNLMTYVVPAALNSLFIAVASDDTTAYAAVPGIAPMIVQDVAAAL